MLVLNDSSLIELPNQLGALAAIARDPSYAVTPIAAHPIGFVESPAFDVTFITPTFVGNQATFTVPDTVQRIEAIEQAGVIYTLAIDPNNPAPGEFIYNSVTGAVTVFGSAPLPQSFPLIVRSQESVVMLPDDLLTDLAQLPGIFGQYELEGEVNWSCDWEGHPTGSFDLSCDWATADALESIIIPKKTTLQIFGVGFQVDALSMVKQSPLTVPELTATVSISMRGKWEDLLGESVVLDSQGSSISAYGTFGTAGTGSVGGGSAKPVGSRTIRGSTNVQAIASTIGVPLQFPPSPIPAPKEPGGETTLSLEQAIADNLRHNGCFADYCRADKVRSRGLSSTPIHIVSFYDLINEDLEIGVSASPRSFDYKNSPLEWGSTEGATTSGEDTQGNPKRAPKPEWKLKPAKKEVITTGAPTLDRPSDVSGDNKSGVNFAFDNGGVTRTQEVTTTENGSIIRKFTTKKGFAPVACDDLYYYNGSKWVETGGLTGTWQTIEELETTYIYDVDTGYLINILTTGRRKVRLKKEGSNESLAAFRAWQSSTGNVKALTKLSFYRYQDVPVREETVFSLKRLRDRYPDMPPPPTEDWQIKEPKFLPDGRLNPAATFPTLPGSSVADVVEGGAIYTVFNAKVRIPGYTDPHYCDLEVSKKYCFISAPDPASTQSKPLPDLSAGEDKEVEKAIYIPEPGEKIVDLGLNKPDSSFGETEVYITHEKIQTRKESSFARTATDSGQELNKGRPPEHTRKTRQYEKLNPNKDQDNKNALPNEIDYRISTIAFPDIRIVGSSQSYPYAKSLGQALVGAASDFEINNTRNTKSTSIEVSWSVGGGIEVGDRVNLDGHGLWRVLSFSKGLEIVSPGIVRPKVVELQLGKIPLGTAISVATLPKKQQGTQSGSVSTVTTTGVSVGINFNSGDLVVGASAGKPNG